MGKERIQALELLGRVVTSFVGNDEVCAYPLGGNTG